MNAQNMTEVERYFFDTQGYLVIEDVLKPDEVRRLIAGIPRNADGSYVTSEGDLVGPLGYPEPLYRELINHARILPYLAEIFCHGEDPWEKSFYLEHEYGMVFKKGDKGPWFHNGGTPHSTWCSYQVRDGKIFCGLTAVIWALTDVKEGDGGFCCIPGSHKANFPLPKDVQSCESPWALQRAVQPAVRAGSVILFTEALTHGTRNWQAPYERIALFYKYSPGYMAKTRIRPQKLLERMTDEQRKYLMSEQALSDPRQ